MICGISAEQRLVSSIIPPLTFNSHKGEAGRIGIIGGSKEYTGAPYFAAITALRVGCDLSHVFCMKDAATVIKSYSPELIVHPILDGPNAAEKISLFLPHLHSLVVGPGLGRDDKIFETVKIVIEHAKDMNLPLILDADALFYINSDPGLIYGYKRAILTPNAMEFSRLYRAVMSCDPDPKAPVENVKTLATKLGNVTLARKGSEDIISNGEKSVTCTERGSPRRCGGQGDLLSGSAGVFSYWAHRAYDSYAKEPHQLPPLGPTLVAALGACMLTRRCNLLAFMKHNRGMTTSEMIQEITTAFPVIFPTT